MSGFVAGHVNNYVLLRIAIVSLLPEFSIKIFIIRFWYVIAFVFRNTLALYLCSSFSTCKIKSMN